MNPSLAQANADALSAVQHETGHTLPAATYSKWRPTKRVSGSITGIADGVRCLATDGNLGLFVLANDTTHPTLGKAFVGHTQHFEWQDDAEEWRNGAPPTLHTESKEKPAKEKKVKKLTKRQEMLSTL